MKQPVIIGKHGTATIAKQHPSKQGLKLNLDDIYKQNAKIAKQHPSKQGLKPDVQVYNTADTTDRKATSIKTRIETHIRPPIVNDVQNCKGAGYRIQSS